MSAVVVTGAAGWLASSIATSLAELGYQVFALDKKTALEESHGRLRNSAIECIEVDFFDKEKSLQTMSELAKNKQICAIVNAAYSFGSSNIFTGCDGIKINDIEEDQFTGDVEVAVGWAFRVIKCFHSNLQQTEGSIINIGSMYSHKAPNPSLYKGGFEQYTSKLSYTVGKHALLGMTRYLAAFFAEDNIRVNMVSPGAFSKPGTDLKFIDELNSRIPMGRIGNPRDLNGVVKFLVGNESSYITGQSFLVDGGWGIV